LFDHGDDARAQFDSQARERNAIEHYRIDDILISTLKGEQSKWLEEGLIENAGRVGAVLQDGLREIASTRPQVTDVRGLGLMLALELKTPELAAQLVQSAFERGLLLLTAGSRAVRISGVRAGSEWTRNHGSTAMQ